MKKLAFTLMEQMIVFILVGILTAIITSVVRPKEINGQAVKKASINLFRQIEFATVQIVARNTKNNTLTRLTDASGEFSIASSDSLDRLVAIYKKNLIGLRMVSLEASYTSPDLTDGTTTYKDLKVSSFKGFTLKNQAYFGIKLNGNCTSEISYIYDPSTPTARTKTNVCATLFFDVNGESTPNLLGYDQYIVALGKRGIK